MKQPDGSIKALTPRQVVDLLGHSTSEITERHYVKKDTTYLNGITDDFRCENLFVTKRCSKAINYKRIKNPVKLVDFELFMFYRNLE